MVYKRIFLARVFTIEKKKRNHLLVYFRDTHMIYNGKMRLLKRMTLICPYLEHPYAIV